jgi:hypothetical protein
MPRENDRSEPWVGPPVHDSRGNNVIAFVFIAAIMVVFGLLAAAFGAETRDGFQPLGVPLLLGSSSGLDDDRAAAAVD